MAEGAALTPAQIDAAIAFNNGRHAASWITLAAMVLKYPANLIPAVDARFVELVADFQEKAIGPGAGNGKIDPRTEAHLGIVHPRALDAVARARAIMRRGGILFDSWGNDLRDNDMDWDADGPSEQGFADGDHSGRRGRSRIYPRFNVVRGTYGKLGWRRNRSVTVTTTDEVQEIEGPFEYLVCADVVSRAYQQAGVMQKTTQSTEVLIYRFSKVGYVWRRTERYPSSFLPGDLVATLSSHIGHSGIVVEATSTESVPTVFELPGPSTMVDEGKYDPTETNDVRIGPWSKRHLLANAQVNYLGRILHSKLP